MENRKVIGWAIINQRGTLMSVKDSRKSARATWLTFSHASDTYKVVKCKITYSL